MAYALLFVPDVAEQVARFNFPKLFPVVLRACAQPLAAGLMHALLC